MLGNLLSYYQTNPEPEIGYGRSIIALDSNNFIIYGLAKKQVIGTTKYVQPTLTGFDSDFNELWSYNLGVITRIISDNTFYKFVKSEDNNIVGAGVIPEDAVSGWLYKFAPNGDSIWDRRLHPAAFPGPFPNRGKLSGVGILSSGSIIAGGEAGDGQHYYGWVVKVTNDGCIDTLFCQTSAVWEVPVLEERVELNVYPNPADDYVNLSFGPFSNESYLFISDALGRVVYEAVIPFRQSNWRIVTNGLPPGFYSVKLLGDGRSLGAKLLVLHAK